MYMKATQTITRSNEVGRHENKYMMNALMLMCMAYFRSKKHTLLMMRTHEVW